MRRRLVVSMTLVCLAGLLSSNSARAAAGALDPSFGNGGKVLTRFKNCGLSICNAQPADTVLQSDGKIVVAINFLGFEFGAVRYTSNGALDQTFGAHGLATVAFANNDLTTVYGEALQSDGKIILAGNVENPTSDAFALVRLEPSSSKMVFLARLEEYGFIVGTKWALQCLVHQLLHNLRVVAVNSSEDLSEFLTLDERPH